MKKIILFLAISLGLIAGLWYLEQRGIVTWRVRMPFFESTASPNMRMVFMDIGQGDATLITFPNKETMLVDCARDAAILSALGRNLPWFKREINYLIVTHPDADHYGGCIDVLKRYNVKHVYFNGFEKEGSQLLQTFQYTVADEERLGADLTIVSTTRELIIASTTVHFLYPDHSIARDPRVPGASSIESNNTSIVMKISYGGQDILMTGDMEMPLENYMAKKYGSLLDVEVLKVGHHGSKSSSGEEFLRLVSPQYCIISAGKNNSFGHPAERVLKRLERSGCDILRTDHIGDILFTITSEKITTEHEQI